MKGLLTSLRRRFARDDRGATAVEFAMVALPLSMLLGGIFELALVYLVSSTLENATATAARTIRTNQFQTNGGSQSSFKTAICDELTWLGSECQGNLTVDVRVMNNFQDLGPIDPQSTQFQPGAAGDIVLVRSQYKWHVITPWLAGMKMTGDGAVLSAAATFRNEP